MKKMDEPINVFGEKLEICGVDPITGFYRDGACNTCKDDFGSHTVCIETSQEFLEYSKSKGNDLSTPMPAFNFKGLAPGESWCVCAGRWLRISVCPAGCSGFIRPPVPASSGQANSSLT